MNTKKKHFNWLKPLFYTYTQLLVDNQTFILTDKLGQVLGEKIRVVISSCVATKTRRIFPDDALN